MCLDGDTLGTAAVVAAAWAVGTKISCPRDLVLGPTATVCGARRSWPLEIDIWFAVGV